MKVSSLLSFISIFTIALSFTDAALADETKKVRIASFIGVQIGADIAQYEETLAYSRNQTRKMYIDEIVDAAVKLSGGYFNPASMLAPLQKIQEAADQKRDANKVIDSANIGLSVGEFFKSEMEKLHTVNGITDAERRIEFANMFPVINGRMLYNSKAEYDHYVYIQMAHIGGGQFRMTGTLGSINESGVERSFEGAGFLEDALAEVATGIFRSIMQTQRPAWKNPNPELTWIPGPASLSSLDAREARLYCSSQEARLPLADELILAHHGTDYRVGGINRFKIGEHYFVADQMRQLGVPYIVLFQNNGERGVVNIQAVAGQKGKVWCVKGAMSERNEFIQKLYSVRRKLDPKGMSIAFFPESVPTKNLAGLKAIESLLINLNAPGAELDVSLKQSDLMGTDEALSQLKALDINLLIPKAILDTLTY